MRYANQIAQEPMMRHAEYMTFQASVLELMFMAINLPHTRLVLNKK